MGILKQKDPIKYSQINKPILQFFLDIEERSYENKKQSYRFKVVCFNDLAALVSSSIEVGSLIQVMGKLTSKEYINKMSQKAYAIEIIAFKVYEIRNHSAPKTNQVEEYFEDLRKERESREGICF